MRISDFIPQPLHVIFQSAGDLKVLKNNHSDTDYIVQVTALKIILATRDCFLVLANIAGMIVLPNFLSLTTVFCISLISPAPIAAVQLISGYIALALAIEGIASSSFACLGFAVVFTGLYLGAGKLYRYEFEKQIKQWEQNVYSLSFRQIDLILREYSEWTQKIILSF